MAESDSPEMGRPKKPPGEVRKHKLEIRLSDAEKKLFTDRLSGSISTWVRETAIRAVKRLKKK